MTSREMMGHATDILLTAVVGLAALTQLFGLGHWVQAFDRLGGEPWGRYPVALIGLAAAALYWWPGRRGYGAALMLAIGLGAVIAHLAVLGPGSAPPALLTAGLAAWVLWRHQEDLRR